MRPPSKRLPGSLEAVCVLGYGDLREQPRSLLLAKGGDAVLLAHLEQLLSVERAALLQNSLPELLLLEPVSGTRFNSISTYNFIRPFWGQFWDIFGTFYEQVEQKLGGFLRT